jgi:hypothetical protein
MSSVNIEHLYQLLPAIYRLRDAEQGYPLRALIRVLARQAQVVEADIARLYENWFIETCDEWVVPYLGNLLGVRGLLPPERAGWSQRALVANTMQYRQRKGTVPLLEQLVHDVTGWAARAVELYNEVGVTQHLDHLRPALGGTANLRALRDKSLVGSAFDPLAYTPDVRLMSGTRQAPHLKAERPIPRSGRQLAGVGQNRPNLPNIGLYIWRLKAYRLERATAYSHGDGRRFSFSPLGNDIPLFNTPRERHDFATLAQEYELPVTLRNQALSDELARLPALDDNREPAPGFLTPQPAFQVYGTSSEAPISLDQVLIDDLSDWRDLKQLVARLSERHQNKIGQSEIVVDPELGRIFFLDGKHDAVRVTYSYGFSGNVGGGPYDRRRLAKGQTDMGTNQVAFGTLIHTDEPTPMDKYPLSTQLRQWAGNKRPPAVIELSGNATYFLAEQKVPTKRNKRVMLDIQLDGSQLVIQAANRYRPVIVGDLNIMCSAATAELTLGGLLIAGQIQISGPLGKLKIVDCTCVPGITMDFPSAAPSLTATDKATALQVGIERSIVGPVCLPKTVGGLSISDSIIDAPEPDSVKSGSSISTTQTKESEQVSRARIRRPPYASVVIEPVGKGQLSAIGGDASGASPGPATSLERVTIFGQVHVCKMPVANDVLFTSPVVVERTDTGVMRHSYIPIGSKTPRRENCLQIGTPAKKAFLPAFTARHYGEPGYAQLSLACPAEIRTGGTDGAEVGVFHDLRQPQREGALLAQLEEYLRFGLEAGLIYVT